MKKFLLSSSVIILFAVYVAFTAAKSGPVEQTPPVVLHGNRNDSAHEDEETYEDFGETDSSVRAPAPLPLPEPQPTPQPQPTPAPVSAPVSGGYKDGSYTGSSADAYYGYVQVKAVIQGGKIADVQFLRHPNDRSTSVMINNYAMPRLTSEAIQAQNSNVDIISGATDTSIAFNESLSAALAQAKN